MLTRGRNNKTRNVNGKAEGAQANAVQTLTVFGMVLLSLPRLIKFTQAVILKVVKVFALRRNELPIVKACSDGETDFAGCYNL